MVCILKKNLKIPMRSSSVISRNYNSKWPFFSSKKRNARWSRFCARELRKPIEQKCGLQSQIVRLLYRGPFTVSFTTVHKKKKESYHQCMRYGYLATRTYQYHTTVKPSFLSSGRPSIRISQRRHGLLRVYFRMELSQVAISIAVGPRLHAGSGCAGPGAGWTVTGAARREEGPDGSR